MIIVTSAYLRLSSTEHKTLTLQIRSKLLPFSRSVFLCLSVAVSLCLYFWLSLSLPPSVPPTLSLSLSLTHTHTRCYRLKKWYFTREKDALKNIQQRRQLAPVDETKIRTKFSHMLHRIHVAQLFLSASRFLPDKGSYAEDILFRRTNEKFSFLSSVRFELFFPERWQPHLFLFYLVIFLFCFIFGLQENPFVLSLCPYELCPRWISYCGSIYGVHAATDPSNWINYGLPMNKRQPRPSCNSIGGSLGVQPTEITGWEVGGVCQDEGGVGVLCESTLQLSVCWND